MTYLTRAQLVAALGVSERTWERYLASGVLKEIGHVTAGGHRRFTTEDMGRIKECLAKHAKSRGSSSGPAGSGMPAGTTPPAAELAALQWVRQKLARRKFASRRSSPKAASQPLAAPLAAMLE